MKEVQRYAVISNSYLGDGKARNVRFVRASAEV